MGEEIRAQVEIFLCRNRECQLDSKFFNEINFLKIYSFLSLFCQKCTNLTVFEKKRCTDNFEHVSFNSYFAVHFFEKSQNPGLEVSDEKIVIGDRKPIAWATF